MPGSAGELAQQEDLGTTGTFRTALLHTRDVESAARFYGISAGNCRTARGYRSRCVVNASRAFDALMRTTTSGCRTSQWTTSVRSQMQR